MKNNEDILKEFENEEELRNKIKIKLGKAKKEFLLREKFIEKQQKYWVKLGKSQKPEKKYESVRMIEPRHNDSYILTQSLLQREISILEDLLIKQKD